MPNDRVLCINCANLRGGWCVNARQAGLYERNNRAEISKALAALPQRCPGFSRMSPKTTSGTSA